jgi:hypothetical protein
MDPGVFVGAIIEELKGHTSADYELFRSFMIPKWEETLTTFCPHLVNERSDEAKAFIRDEFDVRV